MAKKDSESRGGGMLRGIGGAIGTTVGSALREALLDVTVQVNESAEGLLLKFEDRMSALQRRFLDNLAAFLMLGLAVLFIVLGVFFFLTENAGIDKAYVFGGLGVILLIGGLVFKAKSSK